MKDYNTPLKGKDAKTEAGELKGDAKGEAKK